MQKRVIQNEKIEKGAKPLHEGVEKKHLVKPTPQQPKQGIPPPPIKKKK
ncbi:MAG: hypothetical protein Q7T72_07990 [Bacteroidales bacterium]|nr:hypothetical protein [Bacteroidales bacterium]